MIRTLKSHQSWVRFFLLLILCSLFTYINLPFFLPILLAAIFALGLNDFIVELQKKIKISHNLVVILTLFFGLTLFWLPLALAISRLMFHISTSQKVESEIILAKIQTLQTFSLGFMQKLSDWTHTDITTPTKDLIETLLKKSGQLLLEFSTHFLTQLPSIVLASFVFVLVLLIFLLKSNNVRETTFTFSPLDTHSTANLIGIFKKSCSATLFSTLIIGLTQSAIIGFGSLIFNEGDALLVLTVTFLCSFIPVIGAAPMGFILALLAYIEGRTGAAVGLLFFSIVASSIDNFLKPVIMGGETKISPVLGFTCVIGAVIMFGLPGLILGPVIMNLFIRIAPKILLSAQ